MSGVSVMTCLLNIERLSMPSSIAVRIITALPSINAPNAGKTTWFIAAAATAIAPIASTIKPENGCKPNWIANYPAITS
jgi:hypothetical protein